MKLTAFFLFVYTACIMFLTVHFTRTYDRIKPTGFDYAVNVTDTGTQIYTMQGKFVDFVPFDSTSQFDRAILADNL